MPWCPKCRNEYMTSAKRCADCAVDLVPDLAAFEQRRAQEESERMLRVEGPAG
jgi:predicted amidophosphoribosyltransferase